MILPFFKTVRSGQMCVRVTFARVCPTVMLLEDLSPSVTVYTKHACVVYSINSRGDTLCTSCLGDLTLGWSPRNNLKTNHCKTLFQNQQLCSNSHYKNLTTIHEFLICSRTLRGQFCFSFVLLHQQKHPLSGPELSTNSL